MKEVEKERQDFALKIAKYIKKDKINHAYLIETNYQNRIEIAKELVQILLGYESLEDVEKLSNNTDLIVLTTDLQSIKKEEILTLKEKFKTKSVNNSKRVYIIEEAEKLNNFSANTLLKFLEEPEEDIIGILVTSNRNMVINTIVSRCQVIRYFVEEEKKEIQDDEITNTLFDFALTVEKNKEKTIAYINKFYRKEILDRNTFVDFLKNLLYLYSDVLHFKIGTEIEYFPSFKEKIEQISSYNEIKDIKNKMDAVCECIEKTKYNPNIKLLLDRLVILMSGVDVNV